MRYHIKNRSVYTPILIENQRGDNDEKIFSRQETCDVILDQNESVIMTIRDMTLTQNVLYFLNNKKP